LAFVLDRTSQRPAVICSKYGGVEIEDVPEEHIHVFPIEPKEGLTDEIAMAVTKTLE
jgi:succinyl-CoA synthetase beta subunit